MGEWVADSDGSPLSAVDRGDAAAVRLAGDRAMAEQPHAFGLDKLQLLKITRVPQFSCRSYMSIQIEHEYDTS